MIHCLEKILMTREMVQSGRSGEFVLCCLFWFSYARSSRVLPVEWQWRRKRVLRGCYYTTTRQQHEQKCVQLSLYYLSRYYIFISKLRGRSERRFIRYFWAKRGLESWHIITERSEEIILSLATLSSEVSVLHFSCFTVMSEARVHRQVSSVARSRLDASIFKILFELSLRSLWLFRGEKVVSKASYRWQASPTLWSN